MSDTTAGSASDPARVPPRIAPRTRTRPVLLALIVLGALGGAALLFWFNPAQYRLYPFCLFHKLTGLHCPGCGGTRALHHLLHGNLLAAFHANALLVAALPVLAAWGVSLAMARRKQSPARRRASPAWLWLFLAVAVVFTVLRNLPGCAWLSP